MRDVELFAGPGGFSTGHKLAKLDDVELDGYEWDPDACATAVAAGHKRELADVAAVPLPPRGSVRGLIGAPPCQGFSASGLKLGRGDSPLIMRAIDDMAAGMDPEYVMDALHRACADHRSSLVLQPLRWALAVNPEWICLEQVPPVLPIWNAMADALVERGYSVFTGVLSAERYGVPQTCRRAFLAANRVSGEVRMPMPTHSRYHSRNPQRLDPGMPKWVSMAEALGWGMTARPSHTVTSGGTGSGGGVEVFGNYSRRVIMERERNEGRWADEDLVGFPRRADHQERIEIDGVEYRARDLRPGSVPAFALTEKARSWIRFAGAGRTAQQTAGQIPRELDEPAHTITGKGTAVWLTGDARARATRRGLDEPAATIMSSRLGNPRWEAGDPQDQRNYERKNVALRQVTVAEAAVLQSFPHDYPFQGSRTAQFRQVGDAVPPQLAMHVLRAAAGLS